MVRALVRFFNVDCCVFWRTWWLCLREMFKRPREGRNVLAQTLFEGIIIFVHRNISGEFTVFLRDIFPGPYVFYLTGSPRGGIHFCLCILCVPLTARRLQIIVEPVAKLYAEALLGGEALHYYLFGKPLT